ncbi:MBL fold metallo-hydrolase [Halovenus sp. WSH3]|uniref:MBL fold metallo-hydrolase n=1 Tax=Halovenus carboxidivorans TaxID=2692199 RepID=A0A6B0T4U1_9EURY|nr:MBL fold metallo-hydrolase [Halovenus carboxidivorans]MXR50312.1 MBL fold metallo-hydrolase [Halovenus carboxidivorans]
MEVEFLGGAGEVGRSALLVNESLLLDYGIKTENPPQYPVGDVDPEAVVVSHGHLDHAGAVPALLTGSSRPPVHWTPPTRALALRLAEDTLKLHGNTPQCPFTETHVRRLTEVSETHGYRESFEVAGHEVTFFNAGHIPGSAHVLVDDGETRLLYTGDFHTDDQRLVSATTARPDVDAVITESTYHDVSHSDRAALEERFVESVQTTVWQGGTVVVPVFAIGRAQEILLICADNDIDCYLDGMAKGVSRTLRQYPDYVRDPEALRRAVSNARFVTGRDGQRDRLTEKNTVILTTAGMLGGGPVVSYIPRIRQHPTNKIALTGYQVEGTPGRELVERGRAEFDGRVLPVSAQVEQYDFSAHADREGLRTFLDAYEETPIIVNHGDDCAGYADRLAADGFETTAPELGETVSVEP